MAGRLCCVQGIMWRRGKDTDVDYRTAAQIITSDHGQLDAIERQATRPQTGIYERLSMLADDIRAGNDYEYAWQLFRFGHFRRMDDAQAATEIGRAHV